LSLEEERNKRASTSPSVDLSLKDYVAFAIALAETTLLPFILLAIVVAIVGILMSMLFLY